MLQELARRIESAQFLRKNPILDRADFETATSTSIFQRRQCQRRWVLDCVVPADNHQSRSALSLDAVADVYLSKTCRCKIHVCFAQLLHLSPYMARLVDIIICKASYHGTVMLDGGSDMDRQRDVDDPSGLCHGLA